VFAFSRIFLLGILIFKGLTARRVYKSFGFTGLNSSSVSTLEKITNKGLLRHNNESSSTKLLFHTKTSLNFLQRSQCTISVYRTLTVSCCFGNSPCINVLDNRWNIHLQWLFSCDRNFQNILLSVLHLRMHLYAPLCCWFYRTPLPHNAWDFSVGLLQFKFFKIKRLNESNRKHKSAKNSGP
jgi:hypothetical protein